MSLGLNLNLNSGSSSSGDWAPEPRHKSAGLACLLSFLVPGVGQLYCQKTGRGLLTLGFLVLGFFLRVVGDRSDIGLLVGFALWVFAFLDAYFTAIEINSGIDDQVDLENPRVAAVLNFLTAGLGYFYLGERAKGITLFLVLNLLKFGVGGSTGYWKGVVALLSITISVVMSADAWRIATQRIQGIVRSLQNGPIPAAKPSRLPVFVPLGIGALACAAFLGLIVFGVTITALRSAGVLKELALGSQPAKGLRRQPTAFDRDVGDLLTTVQDVQRVEHKDQYDAGELSRLEQDVSRLNTVLGNGNLTSQDASVSYYYRGQALRLMNEVRLQQGESADSSTAQGSLQDFDKVVAEDSQGYLRDVNAGNAEYYAGLVARDHLGDDRKANSYWEKCASLSHAGCLQMMAMEYVTGTGGQKVDLQQALQLNSFAFSMGVRAGCAGPGAARSIARINHFLGGRRPSDDELTWLKRAYGLMDQFEPAAHSRNACGRSRAEIDEFLYRLERGQRHPELLRDASERVGFDSSAMDGLIEYLLEDSDEQAFGHAMEPVKPGESACAIYFDALWFAHIKRKQSAEKKYYARLKSVAVPACRTELAYARKFGF